MGGERLTGRHWLRLGFATIGIYLLVGGPGGTVAQNRLTAARPFTVVCDQLVFTDGWY